MLAQVCLGNQSYASVVTDPGLLQLYELRDLHIRGVQGFELLDVAGPHPQLIEGPIIRERMLVAPTHPDEDEHTEKHKLVPHDTILSGPGGAEARCVVRDTPAKVQGAKTGPMANGKKEFLGRG